MPNKKVPVKVVSAPSSGTVINQQGAAPLFNGAEAEDLVCGSCGQILGKSVSLKTVNGMVVKCHCGEYNEFTA
jgi:hypothetical protein